MSDTQQEQEQGKESNFQAFTRRLREKGIEVTLASEIDDEANAEARRKKYAVRELRRKLLMGRVSEEDESS